MQITGIALRNFRSYGSIDLPFTAWRTLVIGRNNTGKSSLRDAIKWALTGLCDGLDRGGRGVVLLVRDGAAALEVRVDIKGLGTVVRRFDGKTTTLEVGRYLDDDGEDVFDPVIRGTTGDVQAAILKKLGTREEILEAALGSEFLRLDHDDAKSLLLRLLNVRIEVAVDDLVALGELTAAEAGNDGPPARSVALGELDELEKKARDKRLVAKQRVKDIGTPREPKLPAVLERAPKLEELVTAEARLEAEAGAMIAAEGRRLGDHATASTRVTELEGRLREYQRQMGTVDVDASRTRLDVLQAEKAAAIAQVDRARLADLQAKIADTRGELSSAERVLIAVRAHSPKRGCVLDASIPCKTPATAFAGQVEALDGTRKTLMRKMAADQDAAATIQAAADQLNLLEAEERRIAGALQGYEKTEGAWDQTKRDLDAARAVLEATSATPNPEIDRKREQLAGIRERVQAWRDHAARVGAYQDSLRKLERYQADVARLEVLCSTLGAKGVRVDALAAALERFTRKVNGFLQSWGYGVTFALDPWDVIVNGRPVRMFSKSEKLRIGIALQLAIVEAADLGFAFIDEADMLDPINNSLLAQLVMTTGIGVEGSAGQIIVAATRGDDYEPPAHPHLQVVRLALDDVTGTTATALDLVPIAAG